MATRLNKRQSDSTRQMIKAKRNVEELQKFVDGKREMEADIELTRKWGLKL